MSPSVMTLNAIKSTTHTSQSSLLFQFLTLKYGMGILIYSTPSLTTGFHFDRIKDALSMGDVPFEPSDTLSGIIEPKSLEEFRNATVTFVSISSRCTYVYFTGGIVRWVRQVK
jgi:hypothetical protein